MLRVWEHVITNKLLLTRKVANTPYAFILWPFSFKSNKRQIVAILDDFFSVCEILVPPCCRSQKCNSAPHTYLQLFCMLRDFFLSLNNIFSFNPVPLLLHRVVVFKNFAKSPACWLIQMKRSNLCATKYTVFGCKMALRSRITPRRREKTFRHRDIVSTRCTALCC